MRMLAGRIGSRSSTPTIAAGIIAGGAVAIALMEWLSDWAFLESRYPPRIKLAPAAERAAGAGFSGTCYPFTASSMPSRTRE